MQTAPSNASSFRTPPTLRAANQNEDDTGLLVEVLATLREILTREDARPA